MLQEFVDAVTYRVRQLMEDSIHTMAISKANGVDSNSTADVTPELKIKTDDGREVPYPKISGAKVFFPCGVGGKVGIAYPFKPDDWCVTLFGEGGTGNDLKWDLANATLIPGIVEDHPDQVKKAGEEEAVIIYAPDSTVTIKKDLIEIKQTDTVLTLEKDKIRMLRGATEVTVKDSQVAVTSAEVSIKGNVKVVGQISVTGNVNISGLLTVGGIVMNTHTHPSPAGQTGGPM